MNRKVTPCRALRGSVTPPGDKSLSHRAAILNSLAQGPAIVRHFSAGADCLATLHCLRALGISIEETPEEEGSLFLHIQGGGLGGLREADDVLQAENSGTTLRLLTGLLAGQPFFSMLTGDESLRARPMERVVQPLRLMGAEIWGRAGDTRAPLAIRGRPLKGITYRLPVASAQVKSALLLAGLFAQGPTSLEEPLPSRDHTERFLQAMGVRLEKTGPRLVLSPDSAPLKPLNLRIPGDISAAAFWLVAGAIHPQAEISLREVGINPTRTGVLEVLEAMGARLRVERRREEGGEPVADLLIQSSELHGVEIGGSLIPRLIDEIPVLAVAACVAKGRTVVRDAQELRVKESDRIATTAQELRRLGATVEELPDGLMIEGGEPLYGGTGSSHGDHRLAMALAIAGLVAKGETTIEGAEAVEISYPTFWRDWERLALY